MSRRYHRLPLLAGLVASGLALAGTGEASQKDTVPLAETVAAVEADTQEEIIVKGHLLQLDELRAAITEAEDRVYSRYNELNDDPRFDIACRFEARTGTRLARRTCEPVYLIESRTENVVSTLRNTDANVRLENNITLANQRLSELQRRMRQIAETDPQVQRAMVEHAKLKERYDVLKQRKFNGRTIVWE